MRMRESSPCGRCLRDRPATFAGRFYRFADVTIEPGPTRPDGPPLLVGGRSPAAVRRAARHADGWLPYMVSTRRYADGLAELDRQARAAGRDPEAFHRVVVLFAHVDEDGERARTEALEHLSRRYGMRFERHHVERLCVVGTPEECRARLAAYEEAGAEHVSLNPAVDERGFLEQVERLHALAATGAVA